MERLPALAARVAVSCDFDDTIVLDNLSTALFRRFGRGWDAALAEYRAGRIPVEVWNARALGTVRAPMEELDRFARGQARVRTGFVEFVRFCREEGVPLVVNSSGLDCYILPVLRDLGLADLPVCCGRVGVTDAGFRLRYAAPDGTPLERDAKAAAVAWLKRSCGRVIHIGDGRSDEGAADLADFVFARGHLLDYCRRRSLPHAPFDDFFGVAERIRALGLFREGGRPA